VLVIARRFFPVFVRDEQSLDPEWLDGQDLRERRGSGLDEILDRNGPLFQPRRVDDGDNTVVQARIAREDRTPYFGLLYRTWGERASRFSLRR
jgi:hypothetical protein